mgnify:CR=1 FL=1
MAEVETPLNYFMHYLAPTIVSGFVAIFCFWLGVEREKRKDKKEKEDEIKKQKETVVLSLWEIGIYAEQNKKAISHRVTEIKDGQIFIKKNNLFLLPLDFYEIAKNYNFFDFNYNIKSDFLSLKGSITSVNQIISIYNNMYGQFKDNEGKVTETLRQNEEQITKACDIIYEVYKKMIVSEYLVVPMLKHTELLDEMKKKVKETEKEEGKKK